MDIFQHKGVIRKMILTLFVMAFTIVFVYLKFVERLNLPLHVQILPQHANQLKQLCPIGEIKKGRWINATYNVPPYTPMRGEVQQRTCRDFKVDKIFHTYEWEPDAVHSKGCVFKIWNKTSYCEIMKNKTVAIVGDSVSMDHYLSLTHLLGVPRAAPRARPKDRLITSRVCGNTSTLIGKRDFYLRSLNDVVREHSPDVMVLNRGLHYEDDSTLISHMNQTLFPQLMDWQESCRLKSKDCYLVWRTTVPGHPNCTQFTEPATSVETMEELVRARGNDNGYNWDKMSVQNELVLEAFKLSNIIYEVMDAYHTNILRPDLHDGNDCAHTCLPNDNTYASFLHHMLLNQYSTTANIN